MSDGDVEEPAVKQEEPPVEEPAPVEDVKDDVIEAKAEEAATEQVPAATEQSPRHSHGKSVDFEHKEITEATSKHSTLHDEDELGLGDLDETTAFLEDGEEGEEEIDEEGEEERTTEGESDTEMTAADENLPQRVKSEHTYDQGPSKLKVVLSGFFLDIIEEEVHEEEVESVASEPTPLDRDQYYNIYIDTMTSYGTTKRMNNFLHKKMGDYFKKRKMEHVLREMADHYDDAVVKYAKRLDRFSELIDLDKVQRESIAEELKNMKVLRNQHFNRAEKFFKEFLAREKEIGTGLISTKTGKEIPDKLVDRLIQTQKNKARELQELRLTHLKIRNAVAEKHQAIRALDKISENYTLMEYEQLKIENQGHADKIEEREEDLARLRRKCSSAIQCLAHIREKSSAIEISIRTMKDNLLTKEREKLEARETMNELKQHRDNYRQETQRMKEENGLLTKDKLLVDMEDAMILSDKLELEIQEKRKLLETKKQQMNALRANYEREKKIRSGFEDQKRSIRKKKFTFTASSTTAMRRRPTIAYPQFEKKL